jgi:hypothetical protein
MILRTKWRQINSLRKLPVSERRILAAAAILLPCTTVGLRLFGFKRWSARLSRWAQRCQWGRITEDESHSIRRTVQLMAIAVRYAPHRGTCLSQSLTLWWLLRCQGIESDLRVGVRSVGEQFQAHAWIEYQGQPVNEMQDVKSRFVAFAKPISTVSTLAAIKESVE